MRRAVVVAGVVILAGAMASAPAPGGGACAGAAPWVLDELDHGGPSGPAAAGPSLDVVTYNLHSGLGASLALFRRHDTVERNLRAIAASIATAAADGVAPDLVALNEVDFGSRRSAWIDQAAFVAAELERLTGRPYEVVRGETWRRDLPGMEVRFGNAALSALPVIEARACLFDDLAGCAVSGPAPAIAPRRPRRLLGRLLREPRGVIRVTVELADEPVDVLVTHLDAFDATEREAQAGVMLARLLTPDRTTVLLGDMNAVPGALTRGRWMFSDDRTHAILATGRLADASILHASSLRRKSLAAWATFPAAAPLWGLDWVLGSTDLAPAAVAAIGDAASDHRGLYVRYRRLHDRAAIAAAAARHGRICERLRAYDSACAGG